MAFESLIALLCAAEPGADAPDMPQIIVDPSAGDWVVDRFAGNSTAGPTLIQGPARETGGLGRPGACPLPDGRVLIPFPGGLAEVDREGTLRLVAEEDLLPGTTQQVTANVMAYSPKDGRVYAGGPACVRRLIERPDGAWQLEVIAGTPGKPGFADGPLREATFTRIDSIVINRRGEIFILDANRRIRRLADGRVTTLTSAVHAGGLVDGPLDEARFHMIDLGGNLCGGEDDDTLYLSDHWNFAARRIDLAAMAAGTAAGMPKPAGQTARERRYNKNCDGPALTWASFNSGCAYVCWDAVHEALWCGGPDENRFRWLEGGEVRTVIGAKGADAWPRDGLGTPAEVVRLTWNAVVAVDARGRAYLSASSDPTGLWRAYSRKEVTP
ncbi:MAG: hypothetical protein JXP34_15665 [Planctomycetes bacterium]|nr:hypothetical protein [Planctomycetota bacterium]